MHAFLITGTQKESRYKEITNRITQWQVSSWDTVLLPEVEGSIGIELIRDFQKQLFLTAQNSPAKVGLLHDIHRLTVEAQNALLKILEEPPPNTYIVGETSTPNALLPTILSRFLLVPVGERELTVVSDETKKTIEELLTSSPGKQIALVDAIATTRDEAKTFVDQALLYCHQELKLHPSTKLTTLVRNLLTAQSQLAVNVTPKLVLDAIFV